MIALNMPQRTPEWLLVRAGIPTASQFTKVITPAKLAPSTQMDSYVNMLLAEMLLGGPIETDASAFMERGIELEEEAALWYELQSPEPVSNIGFCLTDDMTVGCSPDLLVGDDGGCEIKVPAVQTHVEYLLGGVVPQKYLLQVQGSMYVTGRQWWDFVSWNPTIPALKVRVERDEKVIGKLAEGLSILTTKLKAGQQRLCDITGGEIGIDKTEIIEKYRQNG